jgi:hypothetical protein
MDTFLGLFTGKTTTDFQLSSNGQTNKANELTDIETLLKGDRTAGSVLWKQETIPRYFPNNQFVKELANLQDPDTLQGLALLLLGKAYLEGDDVLKITQNEAEGMSYLHRLHEAEEQIIKERVESLRTEGAVCIEGHLREHDYPNTVKAQAALILATRYEQTSSCLNDDCELAHSYYGLAAVLDPSNKDAIFNYHRLCIELDSIHTPISFYEVGKRYLEDVPLAHSKKTDAKNIEKGVRHLHLAAERGEAQAAHLLANLNDPLTEDQRFIDDPKAAIKFYDIAIEGYENFELHCQGIGRLISPKGSQKANEMQSEFSDEKQRAINELANLKKSLNSDTSHQIN